MKLYNLLFEQFSSKKEIAAYNKQILMSSLDDILDVPEGFINVNITTSTDYTIFSHNNSFTYYLDLMSLEDKLPFVPDPNNPLTPDEQYLVAIENGTLTFDDADFAYWQKLAENIMDKVSQIPYSELLAKVFTSTLKELHPEEGLTEERTSVYFTIKGIEYLFSIDSFYTGKGRGEINLVLSILGKMTSLYSEIKRIKINEHDIEEIDNAIKRFSLMKGIPSEEQKVIQELKQTLENYIFDLLKDLN